MVILHRQQIGLPGFEPALGRAGLALRAMPVAAGVVGDLVMLTGWAVQHMPAQCRGAALFDGGHDLQLTQAQVAMLSVSPSAARGLRKMSATSSAGRRHGSSLQGLQGLERTDHLAQNIGGDLGIQRRGLQFLVTEQHLDNPNVHLLFQQMRGKAVPQRMHRDALVDPGGLGGGMDGPVELARAERVDRDPCPEIASHLAALFLVHGQTATRRAGAPAGPARAWRSDPCCLCPVRCAASCAGYRCR